MRQLSRKNPGGIVISGHVFISHSTQDDDTVARIRQALEDRGVAVWVDSRRLAGGDLLEPEVVAAIEEARAVVAVLSPAAVNSPWVRKEVRHAVAVAAERDDDYPVIPVLLPGIEPKALGLWFDEEPVAIPVDVGAGGVAAAVPELLAALGELAEVEILRLSPGPRPARRGSPSL